MKGDLEKTGRIEGEPNRTYVSNATYASHGPVNRMQLGGLDRYCRAGFNARLQATSIQFGTNASPSAYLALSYGYGATNNNGNVLSQTINAGGTVFSQTFGYDDINRLRTFNESATAQTYCYDRYGNRAMLNTSYIVASALTPQVGSCTTNGNDPNLPFSNNRTNIGNQDASGNVRWDGATTYTFDAENRITNSTRTVGSISTIVNYRYDGDGRRVRVEVTGGASTNFVYDADGKLLAEYNSQNYPESGTRFRIGDHLGSTRLLFDSSGNVLGFRHQATQSLFSPGRWGGLCDSGFLGRHLCTCGSLPDRIWPPSGPSMPAVTPLSENSKVPATF